MDPMTMLILALAALLTMNVVALEAENESILWVVGSAGADIESRSPQVVLDMAMQTGSAVSDRPPKD
jgi:hypothetical protein